MHTMQKEIAIKYYKRPTYTVTIIIEIITSTIRKAL